MKMAEKSCAHFLEVLASKAPVPGGGGAAAMGGAIGWPYRTWSAI